MGFLIGRNARKQINRIICYVLQIIILSRTNILYNHFIIRSVQFDKSRWFINFTIAQKYAIPTQFLFLQNLLVSFSHAPNSDIKMRLNYHLNKVYFEDFTFRKTHFLIYRSTKLYLKKITQNIFVITWMFFFSKLLLFIKAQSYI